MAPLLSLAFAFAFAVAMAALGGCRGCRATANRNDPDGGATRAAGSSSLTGPWFPPTLEVERFVGAAACGECHREIYEKWQKSPHGRAMSLPTDQSVLGDFAAATIEVDGRRVTPLRDARGFAIRIEEAAGSAPPEEYRVDLVVASGRQHQIYLTRGGDGGLRPLPIYWATRAREWLDIKMHRGASLDPAHPLYWKKSDVVSEGNCFYCHLSQGRARGTGRQMEQAWVDLSINCEACHGAGREHVVARRAGKETPRMPDLRAMDNVEEARLCGRCHAAQRGAHQDGSRDLALLTLASPLLRADGTQFGAGYQYAGHVTRGCYSRGALMCGSCHDPHRQTARSLAGEDAENPHSDRQCNVCHRDLLPELAARAHAHHPPSVRCIDCHMPRHTLFDDQTARQEVSDHGIQIPRPRETIELGLPNACTRCHADKSAPWALDALGRWQQREATIVRPWVVAMARGKKHDPAAMPLLLALVSTPKAPRVPEFVIASVLDLLGELAPDPRVPPAIAPLADHADPYLRGLALRALWVHDEARRAAWVSGAITDGNMMTRTVALDAPERTLMAEGQVSVLARDVEILWTVPPALALRELALMEARAGRFGGALKLVDRAISLGTPRQVEMGRLGPLRDGLAADAARANAGNSGSH